MSGEEFRKLRDSLNSGPRKAVMLKLGNEWTIQYLEDVPEIPEGTNLEGIEYNETAPDGFHSGNLLGFIYVNYNCPATLGYGHRSEEEKRIMKYIWKINQK